ncbi:uncharacterized protein LOC126401483 isoform X3 [Epinephelus moara]|uniref:uncharacterized protein LOC126401483 isoform X3 n=1 Tax=Epinephelus moara TaxID=300413 RepID=UPI00214F0BDB|nr:uncharacterized protein LOC126401483 isoform X3 [Epinephelus moara]
MGANWSESRVRLKKFLSSGITSCVSVRRNDSQGCTADVKDTPPSPKEKLDDLIGPDIDPVGDHDDLMTERNRLSIESFDSGVSFKSDWSKDGLIDFKEGVSPSRLDLSSFEKKHDVADDGFSESPDDLMARRRTLSEPAKSGFHIPLRQQSPLIMATGSIESFDSGVSLKSDWSKAEPIDFKDRVSPSELDFSSSERSTLWHMMKIWSSLQTTWRR